MYTYTHTHCIKEMETMNARNLVKIIREYYVLGTMLNDYMDHLI